MPACSQAEINPKQFRNPSCPTSCPPQRTSCPCWAQVRSSVRMTEGPVGFRLLSAGLRRWSAISGSRVTRTRCTREREWRSRIPPSSQEARSPKGFRAFLFFHPPTPHRGRQPRCSDRWIAPPGNGQRGRSLTTQREVAPVTGRRLISHFADVAQLVARNLAKVEATGSSPVVRSIHTISGVPVHKHWAGSVCMCAGAAAPACSEWSGLLGGFACGHSRDGSFSCPRSSAGSSTDFVNRGVARTKTNRRRGLQFSADWGSGCPRRPHEPGEPQFESGIRYQSLPR